MYNLIEYSSNYSETIGGLWFYSKDEATNFNATVANNNDFKSFKYKDQLLGINEVYGVSDISRNAKIAVPLKYLSNLWRSLKILLINCKNELTLKWKNYSVLPAAGADNNDYNSNNIILIIKETKLYVSIVTLSARDNEKLSKLLSKGFERSVNWNEYKTKHLE